MAGRIIRKRMECRIEFSASDDHVDITYEPETDDAFATVELSGVTVQVAEFDGLIEAMIKIRDEIKAYEANDAEFFGGQRTAPAK